MNIYYEQPTKHISDAKNEENDYSHVENMGDYHPAVKFESDCKLIEKGENKFPYSHSKNWKIIKT